MLRGSEDDTETCTLQRGECKSTSTRLCDRNVARVCEKARTQGGKHVLGLINTDSRSLSIKIQA